MGHLHGHVVGGADVAENDYRAGGLASAIVDGGDTIFDGNFKAVAADERTVWRKVHG